MKNLNKLLLTGLITAGSLGIFGNKSYGQKKQDFEYRYTKIMLVAYDKNLDGKVDKYTFFFNHPTELMSVTYLDEDLDGKMDSWNLKGLSNYDEKPINWLSVKMGEDIKSNSTFNTDKLTINQGEELLNKLKKFPKGIYQFCEEKDCNKPFMLDCVIDLF